jgi:hypothetical protein
MRILPVNDLAHFSEDILFDVWEYARWEVNRCWMELEQTTTRENFDAWHKAWEYENDLYWEVAKREDTKLLQKLARIFGPVRRGQPGTWGGVEI